MDGVRAPDESTPTGLGAAATADSGLRPQPPPTGQSREPAIVGRRRELEVIHQTLAALGDGEHRPVLGIVGEPGIGKSRLLRELAAAAESAGHLVLRGRSSEFEQALPFGVFVDALDRRVTSHDSAWMARMPADTLAELRHALPALRPVLGSTEPELAAERFRAHRAVRALLEELAVEGPVALVLDDMHWADAASVELACHLLRHPPVGRVLVALAMRPVPAAAALTAELAAAVRHGDATVLTLGPLTAAEAGLLAGPPVPAHELERLYAESGGNPFYVEQLARSHRAGEAPSAAPAGFRRDGLPAAVVAVLESELGGLPAPARALALGAAVVGDPFDQDLAAAAADMEPARALGALDLLIEQALTYPTEDPRRFRFRHPIIRRALYESSGPGWRLSAHRRVADALMARGERGPTLAHHLEIAGTQGDEDTIALLIEAADAVAARAPASAAQWYEAAARLLPSTGAVRRRPLLASAAMARAAAGQLELASADVRAVRDELTVDDDIWLSLVCLEAGVNGLLGRHDQARSELLDALVALGPGRASKAAAIQLELAVAGVYASDLAETARWAGEVLATGSPSRPVLHATAAALLALAHYSLGDTRAAARELEEAVATFARLDDESLAERSDAAHWLVLVENFMEHFADAVRHCERGIAVARRTGRSDWLVGIMHCQVAALAATGELQAANELASATVDGARLAGYPLGLSVALWEQSATACLAGDLETALRAGQEAVETASNLAPGILTAMPGAVLARASLEAGLPEAARSQVLGAGGGDPDLPLLFGLSKLLAYETLTRAELALGALEAADQWATRAEGRIHDDSLPLEAAAALRSRAAVLLAGGHGRDAAEVALRAAETAAAAPVEAARARILAGCALARAGERDTAIAELQRAERDLAACGAARYRDEAEAELRRLGRRARRNRAYGTGLDALTGRERQIAELVSAGKTNREIAALCFISTKTVEATLSATYAKLGVSNRAGLTRVIATGGGG